MLGMRDFALVWGFYAGGIVLNFCVYNSILYFVQYTKCLLTYSAGSNTRVLS